MNITSNYDHAIRIAAFDWLNQQIEIYGNILSYNIIQQGVFFKGEKIHLIGATGIWKPKQCVFPISVLTSVSGPYKDSFREDNFIIYSYRGNDPNHHNNVGLRNLMKSNLPLIYFLGVSKNRYRPIFPVYIHHDDPKNLNILLQVDNRNLNEIYELNDFIKDPLRNYMTVEVKRRIHQDVFRENVLTAYQCQCSFCNIRHERLLDAAHIIGDKEAAGEPVITNGLALCKIHHAAYDANFMGVTPDYIIKVNEKLLAEIDGPMLQHGIKELNDRKLYLPKKKEWRPDPEKLEYRYNQFKVA